jgi:hypothetical protein
MDPLAHKRQQILQQMDQIQRMEYGSVQRESRPSKRDPDRPRAYYKHQVWENGQNLSQRIPVDEADALIDAIEGRKRFEQLAEEFVQTTVSMTRAEASPGSKKNATLSKQRSRRRLRDSSKSS